VVTRYNYSPFGRTLALGRDVPQPFRFTGREWDAETRLYYYRARYYSPDMRRFISEDPLRFAAGDVNFYAYVDNNPVNFVDPSGLKNRGGGVRSAPNGYAPYYGPGYGTIWDIADWAASTKLTSIWIPMQNQIQRDMHDKRLNTEIGDNVDAVALVGLYPLRYIGMVKGGSSYITSSDVIRIRLTPEGLKDSKMGDVPKAYLPCPLFPKSKCDEYYGDRKRCPKGNSK